MDELPENTFELNLVFKDKKNAIPALKELGDVFQSVYEYDKWILQNVNNSYTPEYELDDIEYGSIKTKISQIIRGIPDGVIADFDWKKLIGHLLLKAKYLLLHHLESNKKINSKDVLLELASKINIELKKLPPVNPLAVGDINVYMLLQKIETITKSINTLQKGENIEYKSVAGSAIVAKGINVDRMKILLELGASEVVNKTTEILKIKKIDLLSNDAKWDFKWINQSIQAKILDTVWLDKFHRREIIIQPADSLKVILRTVYNFSANVGFSLVQYEILEVLDIISPSLSNEIELFE